MVINSFPGIFSKNPVEYIQLELLCLTVQNELAIKKNEVEILSSTIVSIVSLDKLEKNLVRWHTESFSSKIFHGQIGSKAKGFHKFYRSFLLFVDSTMH